jgi:putative DNA methylase
MPALPAKSGLRYLSLKFEIILAINFPWISRLSGYLPHFEGGERSQSITLRLFDSLPQEVLQKWEIELKEDKYFDRLLKERIEAYLDQGYGECYLRIPEIAEKMQNALLYNDGKKYRLLRWVIMPNHLHCLFVPINDEELSSIMHSFKSYTANEANKLLSRSGTFWQREYHDRFIRDEDHYFNAIHYIDMNPVKAGLCRRPEDWPWSSAYYFKNKAD